MNSPVPPAMDSLRGRGGSLAGLAMELEIRHLKLVRAIVSSGNLTRAGDVLHLTQSALSHQLRDIESRLGVRLFQRVGRRLVLTRAGDRLLRSADVVLDLIERTEASIRGLKGRRGPLRISVEGYTCYHWLPALISAYRSRQPGVDVQIDPDATRDPVRMLVDGRIDIGIIASRPRDRRLSQRALFEDQTVVAVAPGHRFATRRSIGIDDLAGEHVMTGLEADAAHPILTDALVDLVKADLGVAVISRWAIEPYVKQGLVRALTLANHRRWEWSAATLSDTARVVHVRDFIDLLAVSSRNWRF